MPQCQLFRSVRRLFNAKKGILFALLIIFAAGCGGRLIPRDLKDYVSANLKIERRRVELTQPFRTKIILRLNPMTIQEARQAGKDLIKSCLEYYQRDNVTNFINDTLVYVIRLDSDPDTRLSWWTVADDMKMLVQNKMDFEDFLDRCRKEESWSPD